MNLFHQKYINNTKNRSLVWYHGQNQLTAKGCSVKEDVSAVKMHL